MLRIFKEKFNNFFKNISLDNLQLYLLFILLFILPLPISANLPHIPLKTFILTLFLTISLIFTLIKLLTNKTIRLPIHTALFSLLIFLLIAIISTYFSQAKYFSLYANLSSSHSLISYILYFLTFLIILINIEKELLFKNLSLLIFIISLSIFINNILLILSLRYPFSSIVFSSLTEVIIFTSFHFLFALLILIQKPKFIQEKNSFNYFLKLFLIITLILDSIVLIIFNFQLIWLSLSIIFLLLMIRNLIYNIHHTKNALYLFLTILFFLLYITSQEIGIFILSKIPNLPQEFRPNLFLSFNIAFNTLKTNPIIGTGPATFVYNWLKFRPPILNLQNLESTRFDQGFNLPITLITETGLLGFAIFLFFLFYTALTLLTRLTTNENIYLAIPTLYLLITVLFYSSYFIHLSFLFIFLGLVFLNEVKYSIFNLSNTKKAKILTSLILIFSTIIITASLYYITKNFLAGVFYLKSLNKISKNNLDQAINDLNISTILSPTSDLYLRELSALLLQRANIEASLQNPNIQFIQNLITYSIQTAQASIFLNPLEPLNYYALANIYENLSPVNQQFYNLAIENYKKASERDPYNPTYYIRMAILHYNNKNKEQGDTELKKAYLLKPNDQQILQLIRQYMIK